MRTALLVLITGVVGVLSGCKSQAPPIDYAPMGTLRDVMNGVVDPSADFLWNSVSTVVTAKGTERKEPRTDEDWKQAHNHAVALVEATNLLLVPGRHIARPGEKSGQPRFRAIPGRHRRHDGQGPGHVP